MDVGVPEHKIFGLPKSENWWGPPGDSGPCGPCSEIYYDYGEKYAHGDPQEDPKYGPGGEGGDPRFLEIWNLVFNQYEQRKDGTLTPLAKTGIDTGLGLERTTAAVQHALYVYDTDVYTTIFEKITEYTGIALGAAIDRPRHAHRRRPRQEHGLPYSRRRKTGKPAPRVRTSPHNTPGDVASPFEPRHEPGAARRAGRRRGRLQG